MIDEWLKEVKQRANPEDLAIMLVHNGIVRGTSKSGSPLRAMKLWYDQKKLNSISYLWIEKWELKKTKKKASPMGWHYLPRS